MNGDDRIQQMHSTGKKMGKKMKGIPKTYSLAFVLMLCFKCNPSTAYKKHLVIESICILSQCPSSQCICFYDL